MGKGGEKGGEKGGGGRMKDEGCRGKEKAGRSGRVGEFEASFGAERQREGASKRERVGTVCCVVVGAQRVRARLT